LWCTYSYSISAVENRRETQLRSFDALSPEAWMALAILELVCAAGLITPAVLHWHPRLTGVDATLLAIESLVFIWVQVQSRETSSIALSAVLGLLMALSRMGRWP
jgi:DoxX-like protein